MLENTDKAERQFAASQREEEIHQYEEQRLTDKERIAELEAFMSITEREAIVWQKRIKELELSASRHTEQLEEDGDLINRKIDQLKEAKERIEELEAGNERLKTENILMPESERITQFEIVLRQAHDNAESATQVIASQKEALRKHLDAIHGLEADVTGHCLEIARGNSRIAELEAACDNWRVEVAARDKDIADLEAGSKEEEAIRLNLEDLAEASFNDWEKERARVKELEDIHGQCQVHIEKIEANITKQSRLIRSLEKNLVLKDGRIDRLKKKHQEKIKELEDAVWELVYLFDNKRGYTEHHHSCPFNDRLSFESCNCKVSKQKRERDAIVAGVLPPAPTVPHPSEGSGR